MNENKETGSTSCENVLGNNLLKPEEVKDQIYMETQINRKNPLTRLCMRCKQTTATLCSDSCGHYECCNKCAMKMATGGKCISCKSMYTGFKAMPMRTHDVEDEDDHDH